MTPPQSRKAKIRKAKIMICPRGHRTEGAPRNGEQVLCPTCGSPTRSLDFFMHHASRGARVLNASKTPEQRRESARRAVNGRLARVRAKEEARQGTL